MQYSDDINPTTSFVNSSPQGSKLGLYQTMI